MDDGGPYVPGGLPHGSQIVGYQIEEQVGRGGMATVYRATDVRLQRTVALKVLAPELAGDAAFRERFIREMRAAAAVDHPHIVPVFDAGEANGALYIAMLYASGHDVRTLIATKGPLPAPRVADIVAQVASALDAAHSHDLIHRDVKPGNMLLASAAGNGQPYHVYLSDFGLSKQSFSSASLTLTGQFLGTIEYMAPEQVEGSPIDGRADLYGLACSAFEMFTGEPPFKRDQNFAVIWAQLSAPAPSLASQRPDLPPAVDQVFARALAKSPDDRYATCGEFAAALRAASRLSSGTAAAAGPAATGSSRGAADPGGRSRGAARPPLAPTRPAQVQQRPAAVQASAAGQPTVRMGEPGPPSRSAAAPTLPMGQAGAPARPAPADSAGLASGPARLASPADSVGQAGWSARPAPSWRGAQQRPGGLADPMVHMRSGGPSARPQQAAPPRSAPKQPRGRQYPAPRHRGATIVGSIAGCIVMLVIAGVLYAVLRGSGSARPPAPPPGRSSHPVAAGAVSPAATVRSYINAINGHDYQRAWELGGKNSGQSYAGFVQGFDETASDSLTIVSVSGDVVAVRLDAAQINGTVKHFHGTYTVSNGIITVSDIQAGR